MFPVALASITCKRCFYGAIDTPSRCGQPCAVHASSPTPADVGWPWAPSSKHTPYIWLGIDSSIAQISALHLELTQRTSWQEGRCAGRRRLFR
ncbi:MAG: hypothetical protein R2856_08185 [Caldilineaceae bacterium]